MAALVGLVAVEPAEVLPLAVDEPALLDAEQAHLRRIRLPQLKRRRQAHPGQDELIGAGRDDQPARRRRHRRNRARHHPVRQVD